jgi:hypothetical protein
MIYSSLCVFQKKIHRRGFHVWCRRNHQTAQLQAGPVDLIQAGFADARIRVYGRETALDLLLLLHVSSPYILSILCSASMVIMFLFSLLTVQLGESTTCF